MKWHVFLVITLAGCAQSVGENGPDDADRAPEPAVPDAFASPVDHAGCQGIELFLPVPAADVAAWLPPGFTAATDPAMAILGAYECGDDARGFLAIGVEPPAALASARQNHFWEPEHFLRANATLTDAFLEARANATMADIDVQVGGAAASIAIQWPGGSYRFAGTLAAAPNTAPAFAALPSFREYSPAEGGVSYIDAGWGGGDGVLGVTAGRLTTTGDGATAQLFGAASDVRGPAGTTYEYADATVGFIPWP